MEKLILGREAFESFKEALEEECEREVGKRPEESAPVKPKREPFVRSHEKVGRNDPCPCGSKLKFKKCCLPILEGSLQRLIVQSRKELQNNNEVEKSNPVFG
ncbi:MAG: SEC-C metal-binding domain-containing protein [Bacteroidales bacterium]